MVKTKFVLLIGCLGLNVAGCQTMNHPVTEATVDRELNTRPAPNSPPPTAAPEKPRPEFQQESPKSQTP